ncbi:MAG: hypothetical protein PSV35_01565 [bacterium]|nr:hypothetical protein [bacterium]
MNRLSLFLTCIFFFSGSLPVFAVDIPQDEIGSQQFNNMKCLDDSTNTCINDVCSHSEDTDCQDKCRKLAEEKCQQQNN